MESICLFLRYLLYMKNLFFFGVILLSQLLSFSQSERLLDLSVLPVDGDKKALIKWTMAAGSTCLDLVVERSSDNVNYQEAYVYPGVCGNEDSAQSYTWIDANPISVRTSFYRLKLDNVEFSLVSEFIVNAGNQGILVSPNPNSGTFNLEFTNSSNNKFEVLLFQSDGTLIFTESNLNGNKYSRDVSELPRGVYFIKVAVQNSDSQVVKLFIR